MGAAEAFVKNLPEPPVGVPGDDLAFEEYLDMATGTIAPSVNELTNEGDGSPTSGSDENESELSLPTGYPSKSESEIAPSISPLSHQVQPSSDHDEEELPESPSPSPGLALRRFIPPNGNTKCPYHEGFSVYSLFPQM
jgi:hypothetical protein